MVALQMAGRLGLRGLWGSIASGAARASAVRKSLPVMSQRCLATSLLPRTSWRTAAPVWRTAPAVGVRHMASQGKQEGTVKMWNDERGFGFISPISGGDDVFVHRSALGEGVELSQGIAVMYESEWDDRKKKERASSVSPLSGGGAAAGGESAAAAPGGSAAASQQQQQQRP